MPLADTWFFEITGIDYVDNLIGVVAILAAAAGGMYVILACGYFLLFVLPLLIVLAPFMLASWVRNQVRGGRGEGR